ncbi:DUF6049 family protein [Streptacidiphilus rugosus]|uniref:DUF6049 family protein n=1 Tax=Streptacidiphilus rugosus TaxID=405783 RepID=UPI00068C074A|nr:DUF6049 family protein [Streptacidiphilus rugosus]
MRRGGRLAAWGRLTLASGLVLLAGPTLAPAAEAAPQINLTPDAVPLAVGTAPQSTGLAPMASSATVAVTLNTVTPSAPAPTGQVSLSGTVTNHGRSVLDGLHVGLTTTGKALGTRSAIEDTAAAGPTPSSDDGDELTDSALQAKIGTLAVGASANFTITAPVSKLFGSQPDGVYALGIDAQTADRVNQGKPALGIARTFLPIHAANSSDKPTKVATLWPLTESPKIQAQTYIDPSTHVEEPVFTDDDLAASLAQEGRLNQLAGINQTYPGLHPTWVIDPDLIDTVYAMTKPYQVATTDDSQGANSGCNCVKPGTGSKAAAAWLSSLQTTLGAGKPDVVSLPYADPDIASLAHNAAGRQQLSTLLPLTAGALGLDRLQVDAAHNLAWPYQGYTDSSIVKVAKSMGDNQIIVNGASLPDTGDLNFTPNAARPIGGGMTAVVADGALSDIFAGDLSTQARQTAATQQFLAETLKITEERPNEQRSIVVQAPRQMSTATAQTLAKALTEAQTGKWLTTADLNAVVAAGATDGANTSVPSSYPAGPRQSELSGTVFDQVNNIGNGLATLQQILTRPDRLREPFGAAMVRSVSTGWRGERSAADTYSQSADNFMRLLQNAVTIIPKATDVVVPGNNSSAQVAVSVENDLQQTVSKLRLSLYSSSPKRLQVDSVDYDVTIAGGRTKSTFKFKVTTTANGTVPMMATLYSTQDPTKPIAELPFNVNVTSVSTGVITVIASGGLLVVLAGLRLYWKRKKNAALEAANPEIQEP